MALALPTPRLLPLAALASASLLTACPKPDDPDLDDGSGSPGDTETTSAVAPGETASDIPTTGTAPTDTGPSSTSTGLDSTSGQVSSDSTDTGSDTGTTEPEFGHCPYAPGGVDVALSRLQQGVPTDLTARDCGAAEQFSGQVISNAPDQLELAVCADATCGACDPADALTLSLALPDAVVGLPAQLAAGDCLQLGVDWNRAGADPQMCTPSGVSLVGLREGQPEPVPKFIYRYTETLPRNDVLGPFELVGILHGPGELSCPCDGDCCAEQPGARRLRFIAKLWNAEIESAPVDPGTTVPLFAFGTPEGSDLYGDISLVRAVVPSECAAPARHEWLLSVSPG
ncbi:hypothetical protein [Nannocystis radixulma]|uniref:Lipoprotein n=1 Tax=Nannocystis radixulma TaxID=2995305 RepID=A0ABT5BMY8_9BACT|nr:hypothetical protein [Nannocystis radixulma]MDC0674935.1 hypothetical protein [Nannocystis radixulma]